MNRIILSRSIKRSMRNIMIITLTKKRDGREKEERIIPCPQKERDGNGRIYNINRKRRGCLPELQGQGEKGTDANSGKSVRQVRLRVRESKEEEAGTRMRAHKAGRVT